MMNVTICRWLPTWQKELKMRRILIVGSLLLFIALSFTSALAVDATSAWNMYATQYNFRTTSTAVPNATFAQAYRGSDFSSDFGGILNAVAQALGTSIPPFSGNDMMHASLQNWPDS
jgi:hypothetical protein